MGASPPVPTPIKTMKNTIAGTSFVIASVVCVVMLTYLVSIAMQPNVRDGVYLFGVGFLLIAGFVYLCFAVYYFNGGG